MTIADIQRALLARGYDVGPVDGDPGPKTIAAVTAFQRTAGLVPDGVAGPLTEAALAANHPPRRAEPAEPGWLTLARADIGTLEGVGAGNNPKVVAYYKDAGFPGIRQDSVPWCAAFVGAQLERSGHKPSGSLAARSYEAWGIGLRQPVLGCIATKKRPGASYQGHVFFVVGANASQVFGLGGNQADEVSVEAFPRSAITSFRWPSDVPIPTASTLPATIAGARTGGSEA